MQQVIKSIVVALQNIKANPLHTFLSTLGIIIGVASLVAILALGDGLEQTGREQIEKTTSLQLITISSNEYKTINDVRVPLDSVVQFTMQHKKEIDNIIKDRGTADLFIRRGASAAYQDSSLGINLYGNTAQGIQFINAEYLGRYFNDEEVSLGSNVAFLTGSLAGQWLKEPGNILGEDIEISGEKFRVIGLSDTEDIPSGISVPITAFGRITRGKIYPRVLVKAGNIENVPALKAEVQDHLLKQLPREAFTVSTNQMRVEQFNKGILIFKLVMGAITGISVLVGGIGIMNVLLISVTERTKEIGIRKAAGAKKRDIVLQFMSESVTVSVVGCIFGWLLGMLAIFAFVPIVNNIANFGFQAAVSVGSVIAVAIIALLIGIVFGTYPAYRAANLTPVDAIRHE